MHIKGAQPVEEPKKTIKRDALKAIEKHWQEDWEKRGVFEADMPADNSVTPEMLHEKHPKWMGTIPFPYMNSILHLGHAFTVSKIEFAAGWERLKGKHVLFPFGFHATGMPIKSAADKIAYELEAFGPEFTVPEQSPEEIAAASQAATGGNADMPATRFRSKKSKAAAKSGSRKYQFQNMQDQGLTNAEIAKFADASHWLKHYPSMAMEDLKAMGCKIDWRRSFLTTDHNPYYDSFAQWQFKHLREIGKIKFGNRYTIWSTKDGQPCMDHDRQSGEGVVPLKYTGVKLQVLAWSLAAQHVVDAIPGLANKRISLVAATQRPETLYGQTNCFVGPKLEYGFFQASNDDEVYVVTEHAARNMAFQELFPANGQIVQLGTIDGQSLVGSKVNAPLCQYPHGIYVLPLETAQSTKGTGIVASVPSESLEDYIALCNLQKQPECYGIKPEWTELLKPIPVISTVTYGEMIAPTLCKQLKINSHKNCDQITKANEIISKESVHNGTMLVGEFKGQLVQEVTSQVHEYLVASGDGFTYAEPESTVISRSGDQCIVALCDQWYFDYGETSWKMLAKRCLAEMEICSDETRKQLEQVLDWLHEWACVRTYGLGSKVPWDSSCLIESLSDSTIYMSYYTFAHLLHRSLDGSVVGPLGLLPDDMGDTEWDYVLLGKQLPADHSKAEQLAELRRSYLYWYPVDIRSSGKDLIQNHLAFFIYVHTAMFPVHKWPRSIRANGHLMLNHLKMSKSTGNMISLREGCEQFGADATRLTLADAGDGMDDANFEVSTANAAVLSLYTLMEWITDASKALGQLAACSSESVKVGDIMLRSESSALSIVDQVFDANMDALTIATGAEYEKTMYRNALKSGFYEFVKLRDWYIGMSADNGMHPDLLRKYINRQVIQLAPITPHWAEHIWKTVLNNTDSIMDARWPVDLPAKPDYTLLEIGEYMHKVARSARDAENALKRRNRKKGKQTATATESSSRVLTIFVSRTRPEWQETVIAALAEIAITESDTLDDSQILGALGRCDMLKNRRAMPFAKEIRKQAKIFGAAAFDSNMRFSEVKVLSELAAYLKRTLEYTEINIVDLANCSALDPEYAKAAEPAILGEPSFLITHI